MEVEQVPIETLVLDQKNARRGDVQALMESLREFGQHRAAVVQRGTNRVLVGNHLVLAAVGLGWTDITVAWVDDDDEQAKRRALADNLISDRSSWDQKQLAMLLSELEADTARSVPGMDDRILDRLLAEVLEEDPPPVYPLVPRAGEAYTYVVVMATNEVDGTWLRNVLGLQEMKSYKSEKVAPSRVIDVPQFKAGLNRVIKRGEPFV